MNVVVLLGALSRPAQLRTLASGSSLVGLEVSIARPGERTETVPVVWPDAPAHAATLDVGEQVVVVGRVRRRFFRAGGSTQSRTEVVAEAVVKARRAKRSRELVAQAAERMAATIGGP